jgi:ABC-2 type transport system permease protein
VRTLVFTVLRRRWIEVVRYPLDLVGGLVIFYIFFLMLFLGARAFGNADIRSGDTLSAVAVGFVVFVLAQQSYQAIGQQLLIESTGGTLEQLAMSPFGLRRVLLIDSLAQSLVLVASLGVVIVPIMLTTGRWLHLDPIAVVPLVVVTMTGVVGLGLAIGGIAIVAKRAQAPAQIIGFAFLFLVAAPVDRQPLLKLLPIAHGNALLRRAMVDGASLTALGGGELAVVLAVNLGWLAMGLAVFRAMEDVARRRALLGQY